MGLVLHFKKDGKDIVSLSDYSVTNLSFKSEFNDNPDQDIDGLRRGIFIRAQVHLASIKSSTGTDKSNSRDKDTKDEPKKDESEQSKIDFEELDGIRKLANIALAQDTAAYVDAAIEVRTSAGVLLKSIEYMRLYFVEYKEYFVSNKPNTYIEMLLRESKIVIE